MGTKLSMLEGENKCTYNFCRKLEWMKEFRIPRRTIRRSQRPLARKLGSWVRIPLKAWIYVCVYSVFVLFCV
jgi:hypothetical protein